MRTFGIGDCNVRVRYVNGKSLSNVVFSLHDIRVSAVSRRMASE